MPARIYRQGLFSSLEQTKATMTATVIDAGDPEVSQVLFRLSRWENLEHAKKI
ncbi:hypothetical protein ACOJAK_13855 [Corynebacterium striatum]|uniref:hypothetical protein n=1 Tax=Corynebacterium striatum TaxID=43770 RepID=UPI003B5C32A2